MQSVYGFEGIDETLDLVPLAARRALDAGGVHLSLEEWRSLPCHAREQIVSFGADDAIDAPQVVEFVLQVIDDPRRTEAYAGPDPAQPPAALVELLGPSRPLEPALWAALRPLDRYALVKVSRRGESSRVARAYDEIVGARSLSNHLTSEGRVLMVDVGEKPITKRRAVASCVVRMAEATLSRLRDGRVQKGDALAVARLAGIMAAKRTPDIIPLCHPIHTTAARIDLLIDDAVPGVRVQATVEAEDRTGVEMEAMVAASVAALALYDMLKGIDRGVVIDQVRLELKEGGRSGRWTRTPEAT